MEVILLEKVRNLGQLGDQVVVKSGYGRNCLIPSGQAVMATKANVEKFEARRAELEAAAAEKLSAAQKRSTQLEGMGDLTIAVRAGEEGKLFGSVAASDIAAAMAEAGVEVAKREINLPAGPMRQVGEFDVRIQLHTDLTHEFKVNIVPE